MENCNYCRHINMTEQEQTDKRMDHRCLKYNVKLWHRNNNPKIEHNYIYPCEQCNGNDFEARAIIDDIENYIGELINESCPDCGSRLVADKFGIKWCSHCSWSNDKGLTEFIKSL